MRWRNLELSRFYLKELREMAGLQDFEFSAQRGNREAEKIYLVQVIRKTENFSFAHLNIELPTT